MSDQNAEGGNSSEVKATLSIDTDPVEVVHERLIRKGNQNAKRAEVIDGVRGIVDGIESGDDVTHSMLTVADKFKLGLLLNRDCDTV